MPDLSSTSDRFDQASRAGTPEALVLTALEITHPDAAAPIRAVNDAQSHCIAGNEFVAARFSARLADDADGQAPRAELVIDNVGNALTQWVEASDGGNGAVVKLMQVAERGVDPWGSHHWSVEWSVELDVVGMRVSAQSVTARLGFDPMLHRPAVQVRHDPDHSPGLF